MSEPQAEKASSPEARFVQVLIQRCQQDKGLAARLRRADNPSTEYQSWDFLASFGIDLEKPHQRLSYITVAAALAKAKLERNGSLKLGRAIADCYSDGNQSDQAKAKLRRVLACDELPELCRVLRPVLALIDSRVAQPLDFVDLLTQLRRFAYGGDSAQRVKAQWAQTFYGKQADSAAQSQEATA